MKKILILILLLVIFTTGCTKYNDLAELTIIKSIGITYDKKYTVYAQIIEYIDKDNKPLMKTINEDGEEIENAFNNLKNKINKDVYLSHIDLLILGNNLTSDNYQSIINYFINNSDFRNDFYCIFSPDVENLLKKSDYDEVEMFLKTNERKNNIIIKNFDNVIKDFIDNEIITLPNITYQEELAYLGNTEYSKKENRYE